MDNIFTMEKSIEKIKQMAASMGMILQAGADDGLIDRFEKKLNIKLPDDFRRFYYFSNGTEGDSDMFRIIPLQEIMENSDSKGFEMQPGTIDFAEYIIYSNVWTLSVDEKDHNNYLIYVPGSGRYDRVDYTHSFAEFLDRYLNGGLYDGILEWEAAIRRNQGL